VTLYFPDDLDPVITLIELFNASAGATEAGIAVVRIEAGRIVDLASSLGETVRHIERNSISASLQRPKTSVFLSHSASLAMKSA
jgi:hypothetical protein